ncbi:MAG: hypothetical protein U9Q97_07190, partial [Acidobacteriota bacterium]|nr:hypothetical protein [Acidobacteriota bacterium]
LSEKHEKTLTDISQRLDRLLDGYINGLIGPAEYKEKKQPLIEEKIEIKQKLDSLRNESIGWFELAKDIVLTCNSVDKAIKERNYANLVQICRKTGSNFVLRDKTLSFSFRKPFDFLAGKMPCLPLGRFPARPAYRAGNMELPSFSKDKSTSPKRIKTACGSRANFCDLFRQKKVQFNWRRGWDSNPRS